jgi:hypothetical protein
MNIEGGFDPLGCAGCGEESWWTRIHYENRLLRGGHYPALGTTVSCGFIAPARGCLVVEN